MPISSASRSSSQPPADRGIVVEFVLFCPFYEENLWDINPMNPRNNVNGLRAIRQDRGLYASNITTSSKHKRRSCARQSAS